MSQPSVEERLTALERELTQIKTQMAMEKPQPESHPWDKVFGVFANSEGFNEAVRFGREYRQAQHPDNDEDVA